VNYVFTGALFAGSAVIALWLAVRFPRLAPKSMLVRGIGALVLGQAVLYAPVGSGSYLALYSSVFAVLLPVLIASWLVAVWLLQGLRELSGSASS
jgi:hypothetical protein